MSPLGFRIHTALWRDTSDISRTKQKPIIDAVGYSTQKMHTATKLAIGLGYLRSVVVVVVGWVTSLTCDHTDPMMAQQNN